MSNQHFVVSYCTLSIVEMSHCTLSTCWNVALYAFHRWNVSDLSCMAVLWGPAGVKMEPCPGLTDEGAWGARQWQYYGGCWGVSLRRSLSPRCVLALMIRMFTGWETETQVLVCFSSLTGGFWCWCSATRRRRRKDKHPELLIIPPGDWAESPVFSCYLCSGFDKSWEEQKLSVYKVEITDWRPLPLI